MESEHGGVGLDVAYHVWNGSDEVNAVAATLFGRGSEFRRSFELAERPPELRRRVSHAVALAHSGLFKNGSGLSF